MQRFLLLAALALCALAPSSTAWSQGRQREKNEQEDARTWMQKKLGYSQKILAGLTKADFDAIKRNAGNMNFLGYLEKSALSGIPGYKQQVTSFEVANNELIRQAQDRNLEGTTLAFTQLTLSCVQCHKLIRDAK